MESYDVFADFEAYPTWYLRTQVILISSSVLIIFQLKLSSQPGGFSRASVPREQAKPKSPRTRRMNHNSSNQHLMPRLSRCANGYRSRSKILSTLWRLRCFCKSFSLLNSCCECRRSVSATFLVHALCSRIIDRKASGSTYAACLFPKCFRRCLSCWFPAHRYNRIQRYR